MTRTPWNKGLSSQIKLNCRKCGNEFFVSPSRLLRNNKPQYCSRKCYTSIPENQAKNIGKHWKLTEEQKLKHSECQIGEKNHNWMGGITDKRKGKEYKQFVRIALRTYGDSCIICGKNKCKIHHLNSYKSYPEQAFNLENVVPICEKHHYDFHKEFGFGQNTKEQFVEWLNSFQEEVKSVETKEVKKSIIYNISLEGNEQFYANGILNHNTPPGILNAEEIEDLIDWSKRHKLPAWAVIRKIEKEGIKAGTTEAPFKSAGGTYRPFMRPALYQCLPEINRFIKETLK